ncbi:DedA family protein [Candidatus Kaiserbacteria bacterium]|nr:DedA family protein [Candidatus Kaiserbacteria bacterium]
MESSVLADILTFIDTSKYALLFFACFFEGTIAMMAGGLLWSIGAAAFWPMYLTLLAADVSSDTCWYLVGRFGTRTFAQKWGHFFGFEPQDLDRVERRFKRFDIQIIILSKLTMGFGLAIPTLITAGTLRVPYPRFLTINTIGAFIWVFAVVLIGAYVGEAFKPLSLSQQIVLSIIILGTSLLALRYAQQRLVEPK